MMSKVCSLKSKGPKFAQSGTSGIRRRETGTANTLAPNAKQITGEAN